MLVHPGIEIQSSKIKNYCINIRIFKVSLNVFERFIKQEFMGFMMLLPTIFIFRLTVRYFYCIKGTSFAEFRIKKMGVILAKFRVRKTVTVFVYVSV